MNPNAVSLLGFVTGVCALIGGGHLAILGATVVLGIICVVSALQYLAVQGQIRQQIAEYEQSVQGKVPLPEDNVVPFQPPDTA